MARAAEAGSGRIGPAGLASLLLHGGAVLFLLMGLPAPPVSPPPLVIEMAFLPAPDAPAEVEAPGEPVAADPSPAEPLPEAEPLAEAPPEAPAEPVVEAAAEPAPVEQPPVEPMPQAPPEPQPVPRPAPQPAPRPRVARPRTTPRMAPAEGGGAPASTPAPAPAPPQAAAPRAVPHSYIAALFAALERRKEYPESARWRRAEGIAILRVLLRRDGSVQAWRIERGTGHEDLDQAVAGMVRRASPLPAPPAELPGETVEFSVPVRFSLR